MLIRKLWEWRWKWCLLGHNYEGLQVVSYDRLNIRWDHILSFYIDIVNIIITSGDDVLTVVLRPVATAALGDLPLLIISLSQ